MSLSLNNKKIKITLFSFLCTIIIFGLNGKTDLSRFKSPFGLRNLMMNMTDVNERCEKSQKKLLEKYTKEVEVKSREGELDKYQVILKEMVEKSKLNNVNKYLPKIIIFFIVLIVDVLLIFLWIVLWCCCCCSRNKKTEATGCSKCVLALFWLLSIIVIAICIFGIILIPSVYKSVNGVLCSLYKLIFHFIDGTQGDFPTSKWKGFEGIQNLIEDYNHAVNVGELPQCEGDSDICGQYNQFKGKIGDIKGENGEFINKLQEAGEKIESVSSPFKKIRNDTLEKVEDAMEGTFDKYCKLVLYLLFGIVGGISLFQLLTLTPYLICKCDCLSCLFHLFWNIEMLFLIISILIGVVLGMVGVISKDFVTLLDYTISSDNLKSDKPFLLDINSNYRNQIDSCFNGDGNLTEFALEGANNFGGYINSYYDEFNQYYTDPQNQDAIKNNQKIKEAFEALDKAMKTLKSLYDDLNSAELSKNFNCTFINYDFTIVTGELKDSFAKNITLFSMALIIACLVEVIAIIIGLSISLNYKGQSYEEPEDQDRHIKMNAKNIRANMDSSNDYLKK